jgi:hypothetical protein
MPRLEVHQLPKDDVYKDIVRVNERHRRDRQGNPIKEGRVCRVIANQRRCFAVLRGYEDSDTPRIRMDDFTRKERLGLDVDKSYDFEFRPAGLIGQLRWAWNAAEMGYQVASRIAVMGLVLGCLAFIPEVARYIHFSGQSLLGQSSLEVSLLKYQRWQHFGQTVLIAGLAGELIHIWFESNTERTNKIIGAICTAVILLGVGIEITGGGYADDVVRKMRAPRSITETQKEETATELRQFGAQEATLFEVSEVDPEIAGITRDLSKTFALAGWKSGFSSWPPTPPLYLRTPMTGILVIVSPAAPGKNVLPAAKALVLELQKEGLEADLSQAFVGPYAPVDNKFTIVVYTK